MIRLVVSVEEKPRRRPAAPRVSPFVHVQRVALDYDEEALGDAYGPLSRFVRSGNRQVIDGLADVGALKNIIPEHRYQRRRVERSDTFP